MSIDENKLSGRELHFLRAWRAISRRPDPVVQHRFHETRKWRFDFAWPEQLVAVEIQGGTWQRGKSGHTTGKGVQSDCDKQNAAVLAGWKVLAFTSVDLERRPAQVIEQVMALLKSAEEN